MTKIRVMIWWTLIALIFAAGTFILVVNFGAQSVANRETGSFHAAVLTITSGGAEYNFEYTEAIPFFEAHMRAEHAWSKKETLRLDDHVFAAGAVDHVSSKVTTHMAWPHYELSDDWAKNIDICTCRERQHATLMQRFRGGLAAMGLIASPKHPANTTVRQASAGS